MLEGQLTSLGTQLVSKSRIVNDDKELAVVTHSGKVAIGKDVESKKLNSENQWGEENQRKKNFQFCITLIKKPHKGQNNLMKTQKWQCWFPKISHHYPQRLKILEWR